MSTDIPDGWRLETIEQAMEAILDYRGIPPPKSSSGVPLITAKIIKRGRLLPADEFVAHGDYDAWMRRGLPRAGDVILTTEAPLGEIARLDERKVALGQRTITLRGKAGLLDNGYLCYALQSAFVQDQLHSRSSGTTVLGIRQSELRHVTVPVPALSEQKAIARVLGALDDKIELNRRMNRTLEEMAAALFRSWFVDFDPVVAASAGRAPFGMDAATAALFPSSFEDSQLGPIPRGWRLEGLGRAMNQTRESVNPLDFPAELFEHFSLPAFDEGREPKRELGAAIKSNKNVVPRNAVLISKLNPHIPRVWCVDDADHKLRRVCSTEFLVFTPLPQRSRAFVSALLSSDEFLSDFCGYVTGTSNSHQRVQASAVAELPIVLPDVTCDAAFGRSAGPLLATVQANVRESNTLAALRDTLLPKLLSGEIRLRDAERAVEAAT